MVAHLLHYFFPDLQREELRKFSLLGIIAFLVIGVYWILRLLKQTLFWKVAFPVALGWADRQGALFQPIAKFWSPFIVLVAVLVYSKLVDVVKKHHLFYIYCTFYGTLFAAMAGLLFFKELYGPEALGKHLLAAVGWTSYFTVESFGSLLPALFWSFTNSITDSESAKWGFPLIVVFAQVGAMCGSVLLLFSESIGSMALMVMLAALLIFSIIAMVAYFMAVMPQSQLVGNKTAAGSEKKKDGFIYGFISGLVLLVSRPYLLGVLIVSTFYEVAMQILEYQMQCQAESCPTFEDPTSFSWFQGMFGVGVNSLSFLVALLGTGYIIKRWGTRISLLVYPISFAIVLGAWFLFFKLGAPNATHLLWATFAAVLFVKGMSYAFNNPVKEIMYIPTSKDAKFKSKGWVDMFGGRFAKASGARITNLYKHDLTQLMMYGTAFSFGLIGVWIVAALYVGKKNQQLIKDGTIVE